VQGSHILTCDDVGVLIDLETGSVLKHGEPAEVETRYTFMRRAFEIGGFPKEANDLVFFKGRFALEDLNNMLHTCGFAGRFYRHNLMGGAA
jgi:hypothetical protein